MAIRTFPPDPPLSPLGPTGPYGMKKLHSVTLVNAKEATLACYLIPLLVTGYYVAS